MQHKSNDIRILIVEDLPEKLEKIKTALSQASFSHENVRLHIDEAGSYTTAIRTLDNSYYDVIILDLKIPIIDGGEPELKNSQHLYNHIKRSKVTKPFFVLGLTSVDQANIDSVLVENPNLSIVKFDNDGAWLSKLVERIDFVIGAKSGLANYLDHNYSLDVLIVTARKSNEFDPILKQIEWVGGVSYSDPRLRKIHNKFGRVKLDDKTTLKFGLVCLDEMGLSHSAAVTVNLINMFRPRHMAMLGMCCGLKKLPKPKKDKDRKHTKLGDVIIASETYCWNEGKYEDNDPELLDSPLFYNRAVGKSSNKDFWKDVARFIDDQGSDIEDGIQEYYGEYDIKEIKKGLIGDVDFKTNAAIHVSPIVSGPCVVNSGGLIGDIEGRFPRAYGLEMEAHSVYTAIEVCFGAKPKTLVIKGVADFGDGTKAKAVQSIASAAAFITYKAILASGI